MQTKYIINIIPKYIFYIYKKHNLIIHFNEKYILELFNFIYKHLNLQLKLFIDLITIDFYKNKNRFYNVYNLLSVKYNSRIMLKTIINKNECINSLYSIYKNCIWYERESFDLFGILYINNPDLRNILTDYGFKGFPFRKDFPLTGFIELYYDSINKQIKYRPISLIQEFKNFKIISPWNYFI